MDNQEKKHSKTSSVNSFPYLDVKVPKLFFSIAYISLFISIVLWVITYISENPTHKLIFCFYPSLSNSYTIIPNLLSLLLQDFSTFCKNIFNQFFLPVMAFFTIVKTGLPMIVPTQNPTTHQTMFPMIPSINSLL